IQRLSLKSGIALLYNEETNNSYDVCLKLTTEALTIQKLDVVCTRGSQSQVNVHLLRTAGDEVIITVRYLREVPSFLKLPLGSPGPSGDHSGESSSLYDCSSHLNGSTALSPPSPSANEPKYEKRWLDAISLPLLMARVSRYKGGPDELRSNCFEVFALNGARPNVLQFCTAAETADWLQAISTKISDLTLENIKLANKYSSSDDQIVHMGWACERAEGKADSRKATFKFLALRGQYFHIFKSPPSSAVEWGQAETTYNLYEVLFKVHKLWMTEDCWLQARLYLGLEHSLEQQDNESLCFSILIGHGQSHTFRAELASDLAVWEKSFQRAVFMEVQRVRVSILLNSVNPGQMFVFYSFCSLLGFILAVTNHVIEKRALTFIYAFCASRYQMTHGSVPAQGLRTNVFSFRISSCCTRLEWLF
uniref:Syntrophin, gamma 2 n=1 Tax=Hippocampus comes TaxID=109280 RepID=A0A3Q2XJN5_HIPCM